MNDAELRDAAVAALEASTVSYPDWKRRVDKGMYGDVKKTKWWQAFDLLEQIEGGATIPEPPTAGEPGPIKGQGYKLVFEDDFDTLDKTFWRSTNKGSSTSGAFWNWAEDDGTHVYVKDGVLNILGPDRHLFTRSKAWQFGYFECRLRYTNTPNAFPGFWMMGDNHLRNQPCTNIKVSEWDIFEGFSGNFPKSHSGALHRNTGSGCGVPDQFNSNSWTNDCGFDLGSNWRTYSGLWTAQTVYWYVEEKLLKQWPVWDTTNQPMRLIFQMANHGGTATDQLRTEVDWVRVWQK